PRKARAGVHRGVGADIVEDDGSVFGQPVTERERRLAAPSAAPPRAEIANHSHYHCDLFSIAIARLPGELSLWLGKGERWHPSSRRSRFGWPEPAPACWPQGWPRARRAPTTRRSKPPPRSPAWRSRAGDTRRPTFGRRPTRSRRLRRSRWSPGA